jgi:hypothetical protein
VGLVAFSVAPNLEKYKEYGVLSEGI